MPDKYSRFADLAAFEVLGVDYRICLTDRKSPIAIVAPHGGRIEGGTSEVAAAIARGDHSIYCFEGLIPGRPHADLHIRSELFDEPQGCDLVMAAEIAIGIHGRADKEDPETTSMGGRDVALRDAIAAALGSAGFEAAIAAKGLRGEDPNNICNRGCRMEGVQLEIPKTLRDRLVANRGLRVRFAEAVRGELAHHMRDPR
ncbi:poly-gamma-glutamate hydrolase family protein [Mesorhizobium sp. M0085]|uniref:poly-gamma-glutamate hydrolase family protein n=1 Tax=Mesorhizobium sp. M0085 TaxID=2956872 RepID=UPI00333B2B8B